MIEHIIYHILNKEQQGQGEVDKNPAPLKANASHQKFLNALNEAYRGRAGKGFGAFDADEDSFPMPKLLTDYAKDKDFYQLSIRMMNLLLNRINNQPLATGGTVFIVDYKENNSNYILVAILSKKTAFSINHWKMIESEMLDIEHLKFAGRINLTDWGNGEKRYISFLKGKDDIAKYFKEFLSCNDALLALEETKKLVRHIEKFAEEKKFDIEKKTEFYAKVTSYINKVINNNELFDLETFSNQVWPQNPQELKNQLGGGDDGIADGFVPDKRASKALYTFTGKTKHWRLSFDRAAITSGNITHENGRIIINDPTQELLKAFD